MFIAGFAEAEIVGTCEKLADPADPVWSTVSARVKFLVEMLLVEVTTPTMLRTQEPALYDVPLLRFSL